MNLRLDQIQKWPTLAEEAQWSASTLARKCGVSLRTLERHFLRNLGKSPRIWLLEKRQERAIEMLREGSSVKETAAYLGYKYPTHFARAFKKYWGSYPVHQKPSFLTQKRELVAKWS